MSKFERLLSSSAAEHGHLCPGQVVGVRMAMLGLRLLGFEAPCGDEELKRLLVYVEMDRCAADAVAHVTRARLGRRSLKFVDYGIMAATFVDLETEQAFRVFSTEEARGLAAAYAPDISNRHHQELMAYQLMPDKILFRVHRVRVDVSEFDLPGPTRRKAVCARCGQVVRDNKEVVVQGQTLCRPCAWGAYYEDIGQIAWPEMNWAPEPRGPRDLQPLGLSVEDHP